MMRPLVFMRSDQQRANAWRSISGMGLVEVLLALVIGGVIACGTLGAFAMAARLSGRSIGKAEAVTYVTQTLEDKRNKIACRRGAETATDAWFLPVTCAPDTGASPIDNGPTPDLLPGGVVPSILGYAGTLRSYDVKRGPDLDGDGEADYLIVSGKVTWNEPN